MVKTAQCMVHELEYQDTENYQRVWVCKNCPYSESIFIECL
jgi:hypothetical protein